MATRFDFDTSYPSTAKQLERADLTLGDYPDGPTNWFDYSNWYSAVSPAQSISTYGGVDVFAVTLIQGQTYEFDIDDAKLNLQIDIIDQTGRRVATHDGSDMNAFIEWQATQTGQYYVAIRHTDNEYTGNFDWQRDTSQVGTYKFTFGSMANSIYQPPASRTYNLSDANNSLSFYDTGEEVRGNGGSDYLLLKGGHDIGLGGSGNDTIYGGTGMDELSGGSGNDILLGEGDDDVLRGDLNDDRLFGGAGRDGLLGGSGNDMLFGDSGRDTLSGEAGRDVLRGGTGVDVLFGGADADVFRFVNGESAAGTNAYGYLDAVQDFSRAQGDKIDLRYAYGDDDSGFLTWRGNLSFSGSGLNQVRAEYAGNGYLVVQVSLDYDTAAEMEFLVRSSLAKSDFLL